MKNILNLFKRKTRNFIIMSEKNTTTYVYNNKYTVLLDWAFCEAQVENYNHEKNKCINLFNQYMKLKKEETNSLNKINR